MKFLTSLLLLVATTCFGAVPDYKAFRGTGGITIVSNPPTGSIVIDGSAIFSPTGGVSATVASNIATSYHSSSTNALTWPFTNMLWSKTVFVDSGIGNDATSARGDASKPSLTLSNAVARSSAGDTIYMRPGTYNLGTNPVTLKEGQTLTGDRNAIVVYRGGLVTNGVGIVMADNASAFGFRLDATNGVGFATAGIGTYGFALVGSQGSFTNATIRDIELHGDSDGIIIVHSNTTSSVIHYNDIHTADDTIVLASAGSSGWGTDLNFHDVQHNRLTVTRPSLFNAASPVKFVVTGSGRTLFANNSLFISNANSAVSMIQPSSDTSIVMVGNNSYFVATTNGSSILEYEDASPSGSATLVDLTGTIAPTLVTLSAGAGTFTPMHQSTTLSNLQAFPAGLTITAPYQADTAPLWKNKWGANGGLTIGITNPAPIGGILTTGTVTMGDPVTNMEVNATSVRIFPGNTGATKFFRVGQPDGVSKSMTYSNAQLRILNASSISTFLHDGINGSGTTTLPGFLNVSNVATFNGRSGSSSLSPALIVSPYQGVDWSADFLQFKSTNGTVLFAVNSNNQVTVYALIGAGTNRFQVLDTNGNKVVFVDTNNLLGASNLNVAGSMEITNKITQNGGGIGADFSGAIVARGGNILDANGPVDGVTRISLTAGGSVAVNGTNGSGAPGVVVNKNGNVLIPSGSPSAGKVLTAVDGTGLATWSAGGGGATAFSNLVDVSLGSIGGPLLDGDTLFYNLAGGFWYNQNPFFQINLTITVLTNITINVGTNMEQSVAVQTSNSFGVVYSGTPMPGERYHIAVFNTNRVVDINMTNNSYNPLVASNVTVYTIKSNSIASFTFINRTNWNAAGTNRWELDREIAKEMELVPGSNITFTTNAFSSTVTVSSSAGGGNVSSNSSGGITAIGVSTNLSPMYITMNGGSVNYLSYTPSTLTFGSTDTGVQDIFWTTANAQYQLAYGTDYNGLIPLGGANDLGSSTHYWGTIYGSNVFIRTGAGQAPAAGKVLVATDSNGQVAWSNAPVIGLQCPVTNGLILFTHPLSGFSRSGSTVTGWQDASGQGNHLTAVGTGLEVIGSDQSACLYFPYGGQQYLTNLTLSINSTNCSIFIVFSPDVFDAGQASGVTSGGLWASAGLNPSLLNFSQSHSGVNNDAGNFVLYYTGAGATFTSLYAEDGIQFGGLVSNPQGAYLRLADKLFPEAAIDQTTSTGVTIGNFNNTYYYSGRMFAIMAYNRPLRSEEVASIRRWSYSAFQIQNRIAQVAIIGDSISAGYLSSNQCSWVKLTSLASPELKVQNYSVTGSTITQWTNKTVYPYINIVSNGIGTNFASRIGVIELGSNEAANTVPDIMGPFTNLCTLARASGFTKLIGSTILPRNLSATNEWCRTNFNALLIASGTTWVDGIANIAGDPIMGLNATATGGIFYNADAVHPNLLGSELLEPIYEKEIKRFLTRP